MTKSHRDIIEAVGWMLVATLFQSAFIPLGVDLCDTGFILTNQQQLYRYGDLVPGGFMTVLSDWVGGWWVSLTERPSWAVARFGGAITGGAIAATTFWTFKEEIERNTLRMALALVAVLFGGHIINYYSLPAVLQSVLFCLLYRWVGGKSVLKSRASLAVVGAMIWVAILSRFPLLVMPIGLLLVMVICKKAAIETINIVDLIVFAAGGFLLSFLVSLVFLNWGMPVAAPLSDFIGFLKPNSALPQDDSHDVKQLLVHYVSRLLKAGVGAVAWIITLYLCGLVKRRGMVLLSWLAALSVGFFLAFFKAKDAYAAIPRFREMFVIALAGLCIWSALDRRRADPRSFWLALSSVILMFSIAIGTNAGLGPAMFGAAPCVCMTFFILERVGRSDGGAAISNIANVRGQFLLTALVVLLAFPWGAGMLYVAPHHLVTRGQDGSRTVAGLHADPGLYGMRGEPEAVRELDEVLTLMRRVCKPNDTAYVAPFMGGLYFLTETKPFIKSTMWDPASELQAMPVYEAARKAAKKVRVVVWTTAGSKNSARSKLRDKAIADYRLSKRYSGRFYEVFAED